MIDILFLALVNAIAFFLGYWIGSARGYRQGLRDTDVERP